MIRYSTILLFCLILLSGCNPYLFELNKYDRKKYRSFVENMSRYGAVEKTADNGFIIHSDASAAIKTPKVTQSVNDMTIKYADGKTGDYSIILRTSMTSLPLGNYIEMQVNYEDSNVNIEDKETGLKKVIPVEIDLEQGNRIFAINDGKYLKIYWDCDEIYNYKTSIPSSEYVIIRTDKYCSLEIEAWEVKYLLEDARYDRIPMYNIF